jgi:hypothetical protein
MGYLSSLEKPSRQMIKCSHPKPLEIVKKKALFFVFVAKKQSSSLMAAVYSLAELSNADPTRFLASVIFR